MSKEQKCAYCDWVAPVSNTGYIKLHYNGTKLCDGIGFEATEMSRLIGRSTEIKLEALNAEASVWKRELRAIDAQECGFCNRMVGITDVRPDGLGKRYFVHHTIGGYVNRCTGAGCVSTLMAEMVKDIEAIPRAHPLRRMRINKLKTKAIYARYK